MKDYNEAYGIKNPELRSAITALVKRIQLLEDSDTDDIAILLYRLSLVDQQRNELFKVASEITRDQINETLENRTSVDDFNPQTATHLPNGAEIIRRAYIDHVGWIWLAKWGAEYVTWRAPFYSPGSTTGGRYLDNESDAVKVYRERLADAGCMLS